MFKRPISLLAGLALTAPLQWALAQTPTVSASVSGYQAIRSGGGIIPPSDWVSIPVTRNDGPLHAEASGEGGSFIVIPGVAGQTGPGQTSAFAAGFASADPGVLHVYGNNRATALPAVGVPQAGLGSSPNIDTAMAHVSAAAGFTDYLTVKDAVQPLGTEVQVPFMFLAEVVSNYPLGYPFWSRHPISAYASFIIPGIGPQNFSTESAYFPWTRSTLPNGNGLYVVRSSPFTVTAHVGDVLAISATFGITGDASVSELTYERDFGGFADARNTAAIWLGELPAGMTITSASGHDYTIDPTRVLSVPEPASHALWLVGLVGLRMFGRRKTARASFGTGLARAS